MNLSKALYLESKEGLCGILFTQDHNKCVTNVKNNANDEMFIEGWNYLHGNKKKYKYERK